MTIVRIGLSPRAKGITRVAAQEHWRTHHAELFARLPDLVSYVQNHAILDAEGIPLLGDPGFDIFSEVEFANEGAMNRAIQSPWFREAIEPDEHTLLDASRRCFLMTQRDVLKERKVDADCMLIAFIGRATASEAKENPPTWIKNQLLAPALVGASSLTIYYVLSVGGALPRPIDVVVARGCKSVQEAVCVHERLQRSQTKAGRLVLHSAVIARKNVVVSGPVLQKSV
jgi:EthD domain